MNELPQDMESWVAFFNQAEIPLLKQTARELARLQADENNLSARAIALIVDQDPMMVFRVLRYMHSHKGKSQLQDLVLVEPAVLMMGTNSFFKNIPLIPIVEDVLKGNLAALTHLLRLVHRAHRAAHYAYDWALLLRDLHAEEVRVAALLHDLVEMLMWCFVPDKMNKIFYMQQADKTLRSQAAQEQVFGFRFVNLQLAVAEACQLPPLLISLMRDAESREQRVRNVSVAVNFARHSGNGWDDAALPDDYKDIAELLRVNVEKAMYIVGAPIPE